MLTPLPPVPCADPAARNPACDAAPTPESGKRFADLLRERRASAAPPQAQADAADAPDVGKSAPDDRVQRPTTPASGTRRPPAPATKQTVAVEPKPADPSATTPTGDTPATPAAATDSPPDAHGAALEDEQALQASLLPPAAQTSALPIRSAGESGPTLDALGARPAGARATREAARLAVSRAFDPSAGQGPTAEATMAQPATPGPLVTAPGDLPRVEPSHPGPEPAGIVTAAPAFARALAQATPPTIVLATPLAAPNFGAALAAQVSVFASDGVQQAELRLNPPEMGPIGVQIEVVGNDARINFHAAHANTREVIERALPELAAALRDEGLTLAGGGVFDRPADTRDGGFASGRESRRPHRATGEALPAASTRPRPVRLGGVDLYA